ncbi:MAG: hypothetical protein SGPRY_007364 [Prymnesium sp.]
MYRGLNLFANLRDSFLYIRSPDKFVADRSAELGPIFMAYQYFKPIVFLGGAKNVDAFTSGEELKNKVIFPTLPDIFIELHTKWGSLNLDANDQKFKEARLLFADVLSGREATAVSTSILERTVDHFVDALAERVAQNPDQPIYLAPQLKSLCLQAFSELFSGQGLTKEQEQSFFDYNNALLSLSRGTSQYEKGRAALEELTEEMLRRFRALDEVDDDSVPGKWYHKQLKGREGFEDEERVGVGMVLFIWGAYVECASLMLNAFLLMTIHGQRDEMANRVLSELKVREESGLNPSEFAFWSRMPYTLGILRETLRLEPPGAGVPRFAKEDFELAGYRIPRGTPVMVEPRVANMDPEVHLAPSKFEPMRWVQRPKTGPECPFHGMALNNGRGSWVPGGFGAHQCPGVPIAELMGRIFLAKMLKRFSAWELNGDGLTKEGRIDYVMIPVKIPPDHLGVKLKIRLA